MSSFQILYVQIFSRFQNNLEQSVMGEVQAKMLTLCQTKHLQLHDFMFNFGALEIHRACCFQKCSALDDFILQASRSCNLRVKRKSKHTGHCQGQGPHTTIDMLCLVC